MIFQSRDADGSKSGDSTHSLIFLFVYMPLIQYLTYSFSDLRAWEQGGH